MFGKLLKYELRSSFRIFLPLWLGLIVIAFVNGFTLNLSEVEGTAAFLSFLIPIILLVGLMTASVVLAIFYIVRRFYSGLLEDEGYLMFTLPVNDMSLIGSKALAALIIELLSGVAAGLAMLAIWVVQPHSGFLKIMGEIWDGICLVMKEEPMWLLIGVELLVIFMLFLCQFNLRLYASMAVGHLAAKHRIFMSCLTFVGIWIVLTILTPITKCGFGTILEGMDVLSTDMGQSPVMSCGDLALSLLLPILWQLVLCAVFFFGTHVLLHKKLNLE